MIVRVVTLGCKVNQYESASIVAALQAKNIDASEGLEFADAYVLNTCSVTAEADRKSRQYITKMRKLNHDCKIIVVGCSSQNNNSAFAKSNVIAIGGTHNKSGFVCEIIDKISSINNENILDDRILYDKNTLNIDKIRQYCSENHAKSNKTRAFIKIQDGCNRFCNYCIIPYLRGRSRSRFIADVKKECENVISKEIVLTGIDVSSYGKDTGESLAKLFRALKNVNARKRLSSLECEAIDRELLDAMQEGGFCPHFHLSLQSGSNEVLRTMNRRYNAEFYLSKIDLIREYYSLAAITTDIIVGYPTETDDLFDEGYDFIKRCAFADIHVFPYSKRSGTLASKKYDVLPSDTVKEREGRLLALKTRLKDDFIQKNLGVVAPVYVETAHNVDYSVGYTPNYLKVYSHAACGDIVNLQLCKPYLDGILGE